MRDYMLRPRLAHRNLQPPPFRGLGAVRKTEGEQLEQMAFCVALGLDLVWATLPDDTRADLFEVAAEILHKVTVGDWPDEVLVAHPDELNG